MLKRYIHILLLLILAGLIFYGIYKNQQRSINEDVATSSAEMGVDNGEFNELPDKPEQMDYKTAKASWYDRSVCGERIYMGTGENACRTASGAVFNEDSNTMACSSHFSLGDVVELCYHSTCIELVCDDRGKFYELYGRSFDLTRGAFKLLAPLSVGVIEVEWRKL